MNASVPVLAIDGPSGSGKGTVARRVATQLGWRLLDSGAVYRVTAVAAAAAGVSAADEQRMAEVASGLPVAFEADAAGDERILLAGVDITKQVRSEETGELASRIAVLPAVRSALLTLQRSFRTPPGLVADGRDMGTVVFPDAACKVFLTASAEARAERRYKQLKEKGFDVRLATLFDDIARRDARDAARVVAPLRPAADAIEIDSTALDVQQVVQRVLDAMAAVKP
ncbi:MAG: (d)CMP kinase [Xanthomonadaceae bacterium]|nr:(d)CMP kinase [Xanthomonadaceae bacterium]